MKKLLIALVILAVIAAAVLVALAYADVEVREYVEVEAEKRLEAAVPMAGDADIEIHAFPFVGWVLVDGSVERLDVALDGLESGGIAVERIALRIDGLQLDRDKLLEERKLAIVDLTRARLQITITSDAIDRVTPVTTRIRNGAMEIDYKGRTFTGKIAVKGRKLVIGVPGIDALQVPLPEEKFLPCDPEVELSGERLVVGCTVTEIPAAVADVLGG